MRNIVGFIAALVVLVGAVGYVYCVPRARYQGKELTAEILEAIPLDSPGWQGGDVRAPGDQFEGEIYNFLSRIFAGEYVHKQGLRPSLLLVVLDAGNFHYPKVCFRGAGYSSEELEQRELNLQSGKLKAHLLLHQKQDERLLSIYWICIDKEVVPSWARQKMKQLYYSLFNKEHVGLMVRVDIAVTEDLEQTVKLAEDFLDDIYAQTAVKYRGYIFGGLDS